MSRHFILTLTQVECRTLTNKLNLMEKEFTRYKAQSKEEIDRNEKTMEEMEGKISEVSSKLLVKKMSEAIDGSFFNLTFSSQGSEECRVVEEKARQCTGAPQN